MSEALRPYCSIIYHIEVNAPAGVRIDDYLHPEWANLRFIAGSVLLASVGSDAPSATAPFIATGPTSRATFFVRRDAGLGDRHPADRLGEILRHSGRFDGRSLLRRGDTPRLRGARPLLEELAAIEDLEVGAALIDARFAAMLAGAPPDDPAIAAAYAALMDDDLGSVGDLADKLGMSERSVERLSQRAFGFSPKLLLRRQRFLRSLARFMLDPSMAWIDTLDYHYYDQAQFTRDFKAFMGIGPRDYAARPKPILGAAAIARAAAAGAAVQGLHKPAG